MKQNESKMKKPLKGCNEPTLFDANNNRLLFEYPQNHEFFDLTPPPEEKSYLQSDPNQVSKAKLWEMDRER